jgi:hypothetical protein
MMAKKSQPGAPQGGSEEAQSSHATPPPSPAHPQPQTAFDVFGSDLPDEAFDEVFNQPRESGWREVDLD